MDRYQNQSHENRPKDLQIIKSSPTNGGIALQQDLILGTYFNNTREITTNSIDLDINVHAIKNMLMTTRVPESSV